MFFQFALQRSAVHFERARSCRNIAFVFRQHLMDMLPFQPPYGKSAWVKLNVGIGFIALQCGQNFIGIDRFGKLMNGTEAHRIDRCGDAGIPRQHDNARRHGQTSQVFNHL